jgi:hypothetical protein
MQKLLFQTIAQTSTKTMRFNRRFLEAGAEMGRIIYLCLNFRNIPIKIVKINMDME